MNIGGVVKDWLLIAVSASVFRSAVTATSLGGYALAFCGVLWYNTHKVAAPEAAAAQATDTSPLLKTPVSSCGESDAQGKIGAIRPEGESCRSMEATGGEGERSADRQGRTRPQSCRLGGCSQGCGATQSSS